MGLPSKSCPCIRLERCASVIEKGVIRYEGTTEELEANDELREAYLTV